LHDPTTPQNSRCAQKCAHFRAGELADDVVEMPFVEVGIYLLRPDRLVAEEHLDGPDVARPHHQIARERVPPGVNVRIRNTQPFQLTTSEAGCIILS